MNEIIKRSSPALSVMSTKEIFERLESLMHETAKAVKQMAEIVAELDNRGEIIHGIGAGMLGYLRRVSKGLVHESIVLRYSEHPRLVHDLSRLSIDLQEEIVDAGTVKLVTSDGAVKDVNPIYLTGRQIQQVIGDGTIRTPEEQQAYLAARVVHQPKPRQKGKLKIDRDRGLIKLNRTDFTPQQLLEAMSLLSGPRRSPDEESDKSVIIKLTDAENKKLKHYAVEAGTSQQTVITDALRAVGVL